MFVFFFSPSSSLLTSELDAFDLRVFEQASRVGGTWVYTENTGIDERGIPVHSSMYRNLR